MGVCPLLLHAVWFLHDLVWLALLRCFNRQYQLTTMSHVSLELALALTMERAKATPLQRALLQHHHMTAAHG